MGIAAFGTLLKIGDGGTPTETFTTVAEVTDIGGPELSLETIDFTHHSSPGGWRQFLPGLKDGGEISFSINFIPTNATQGHATGVLGDLDDRTQRNFQLVFPDAGSTTWTFPALVTKFAPKAPIDDKLSADITLKVAGQPTLA
ncbi:MAG: phage tail tube protein [Chloroflexi bacterium]|nr:phage tail tube protein [Chloroflexota bacterium]